MSLRFALRAGRSVELASQTGPEPSRVILVHLSDLHVRPSGKPAYRVVEASRLAERAMRAVRAFTPRPDAVVISGDLTDNGLPEEYAELRHMLRRHLGGLPVYLIPGNHDRRENFRAALAEFPGVVTDPAFVQYVVDDLPVRLVMLDSVVPGAGHGELCPGRLAWLEARLAEAPDRPTFIVLHHPPMMSGMPVYDGINLRNAAELGALLARYQQVERILCGHHHRSMTGRLGHAIVSVAPGCAHQGAFELEDDRGRFVFEPPAYHVHLRTADGAIVSHLVFVEAFEGPFPYIADPDYPGGKGIVAPG
jgi:3',5'-cyclic-AMP phosphodiesterase